MISMLMVTSMHGGTASRTQFFRATECVIAFKEKNTD